jgi:hypothetical protein
MNMKHAGLVPSKRMNERETLTANSSVFYFLPLKGLKGHREDESSHLDNFPMTLARSEMEGAVT